MVYEPAEDSQLLAKAVRQYARGSVLDVGTGSGIQARTAASKKNVKKIVAVDVDPVAVKQAKARLPKMEVKRSDLFSNVQGHFDTIIFNPPYLPQDEDVDDIALYGGKQGNEIIIRFLQQAGDHLTRNGRILLLFSSLSKKDVIDATLARNLYRYELVEKGHCFMETLYVYKIQKEEVRQEVEAQGLTQLRYLDKGKRGLVLTAYSKNKRVAVKVKNPTSQAMGRIENEAHMLRTLNTHGIGPAYVGAGERYVIYQFVEGTFLPEYLHKSSPRSIKIVLRKILEQCKLMDFLGIAKEEMQRPVKHVLVKGVQPVMIDFERAHYVKKPHNVSQFLQYLSSKHTQETLKEKGLLLPVSKLRRLARAYQHGENVYGKITTLLAGS